MEVSPRSAPMALLVRAAAATDVEMASLHEEINRQRLERMQLNAARLAHHGHLRNGVTVDHAADVLYTCSSPEVYELLVLQQRWPLRDYAEFVYQTITGAILSKPSG